MGANTEAQKAAVWQRHAGQWSQGVATRYTFPTLGALTTATEPGFRLEAVRRGGYKLAERCPTLAFAVES